MNQLEIIEQERKRLQADMFNKNAINLLNAQYGNYIFYFSLAILAGIVTLIVNKVFLLDWATIALLAIVISPVLSLLYGVHNAIAFIATGSNPKINKKTKDAEWKYKWFGRIIPPLLLILGFVIFVYLLNSSSAFKTTQYKLKDNSVLTVQE